MFFCLGFYAIQGNWPFKKYTKAYPTDFKSSLLLCLYALKAVIDVYLTVPVIFLLLIKGNCSNVLLDLYFFASPKSNIYKYCDKSFNPITKLSGLISLWIIYLLYIYSNIETNWYPIAYLQFLKVALLRYYNRISIKWINIKNIWAL